MAVFKPFAALRPVNEKAKSVAALPYDVMSSEEAAKMVEGNDYSFLHIDKAEIDLPKGTDLYSRQVYEKAAANLLALEENGVMKNDEKPCFYIYRQIMCGREQNGLVGLSSIDDYSNNIIKKHENTRADKEQDRVNHVDTCNANTGPIFLTYRPVQEVNEIIEAFKQTHSPVYDFVTDDNIQNTVWVIDEAELNEQISLLLSDVPSFYIADGHHRAASAVRVGKMRREQNPGYTGKEEFNFFLSVLFPCDELAIMDYNRLIADLNGLTEKEFLEKISPCFEIEKVGKECKKPQKRHTFGMYLSGQWYLLAAKEGTFDENDPVASLDVSILQNNLISPVLSIDDPRTDKRIDFVGGIRGMQELERRCGEDMTVAFAMYPTSLEELMAIADAGRLMPPKSTWFEPKLLSGLFIHKLS